jgi:hypothetical protein
LNDSLQKIVKIAPPKKDTSVLDPLKLPMTVRFKNEPGIDEGGLSKEYFKLIMQELFSSKFGMFKFNPDNNYYWFNGKTFESNLNYELVGTLLGLGMYHHYNIEVPLAPCIYKMLLGDKPNMEDMMTWQPGIGNSLQFILDYSDHENAPLEDTLCETFSIEEETFGAIETIDLIENGRDILVSKDNREEYVRLYIEYEFER